MPSSDNRERIIVLNDVFSATFGSKAFAAAAVDAAIAAIVYMYERRISRLMNRERSKTGKWQMCSVVMVERERKKILYHHPHHFIMCINEIIKKGEGND